jgi:hypothetical protein
MADNGWGASSDSDSDEEALVLIIDSGAFTIKAGFGGDEAPVCEFAALVAVSQPAGTTRSDGSDTGGVAAADDDRGVQLPPVEEVDAFYRDPELATACAAALIRAHQLLSFAKARHPRLAKSGNPQLSLDDEDVLLHLAWWWRRRAVGARLLAGCDAGSLRIASKVWRVGDEVATRYDQPN